MRLGRQWWDGRARAAAGRQVHGVRGKLREPTACSSCGALAPDGPWSWDPNPLEPEPLQCPVCGRIASGGPGGFPIGQGAGGR
jgi:hypothetical protein